MMSQVVKPAKSSNFGQKRSCGHRSGKRREASKSQTGGSSAFGPPGNARALSQARDSSSPQFASVYVAP
jgi:hypothetical protein